MTFEQRSARAALLASQHEAAREVLEFAAKLCAAQASVWRTAALGRPDSGGPLSSTLDQVVTVSRPILEVIAERSEEAEKRLKDDPETAKTRLSVFWNEEHNDYIARAMLQPYAEALREARKDPDRLHRQGHCPFCGGAPWISFRKGEEAGVRYLSCSLCGLDWNFNRISCPSCGEEDPHKLPMFQSDAHKNVRLEACETCRRYVKSIDLSRDARPIPEVDDLVSIAMDLWAVEEGWTRIEPGLAGL